MMTAHLAILSFFIGRPIGRARPSPVATQVDERPRGRWAALLRRPWQERAPPLHHLSDHLRRDIGLPPPGRAEPLALVINERSSGWA